MKNKILSMALALACLIPFAGGLLLANAAGSDQALYTIQFDYTLDAAPGAQFQFCFNQRNGNSTNDYLRWIFTNEGLQTGKRGSYRQLISTLYRWNAYNTSNFPADLAAPGLAARAQIDVFQNYIETYVNGALVDTTTFAQINSADTQNGQFAANPSPVGIIAMSSHGTTYLDNLMVIDSRGATPSIYAFADFEAANPFGAYGSIVGGQLQIDNWSGTTDTNVRWINLAQATPPAGAVLELLYDSYAKLSQNDYKSWSWPRFEAAMGAASSVLNDPNSTQADKDAALTEMNAARRALSGANDALNLKRSDPFRPETAINLAFGKGAVEDYFLINFKDSSFFDWIGGRNNCATTQENGALRVDVTGNGNDPYFSMGIPAGMRFSADEYRYARISIKNTSSVSLSEFFFGTDVSPGPLGPDHTPFNISIEDTEFHSYIVDMIDDCDTPGYWTGTVSTFRWDPIERDIVGNRVIYCEYIAFFKTRQEAEAFDFSSVSLTDGIVGGTQSEWQSEDGNLVVDLGAEYLIESVALFPRQDNGAPVNSAMGFPLEYTVDFSLDGASYYGAIYETGKDSASVRSDPQFSVPASPATARYVRVRMTATQPDADYFALAEIAVYGKGGFVNAGTRNMYIPSASVGWNPIFPTQSMYPGDGSLLPPDVAWSSGDPGVIEVDSGGRVTAVGLGTTTLTAYDNSYGVTAKWTVNVLEGQDKTGIMDRIMLSVFFPPCANGSGAVTDDYQYSLLSDAGINFISKLTTYPPATRDEALKIADLCAKYDMWLLTTEMNEWGSGNDMEYVRHMTDEQLEDYVNYWRDIPGVGGFMLIDEPQNRADLQAYGNLVSKMKAMAPELLMHVSDKPNQNLTYVREYANLSMASGYSTDYIGDCEYPFQYGNNSARVKDTWFTYMNNYKTIAQELGIKTHRYLQLTGGAGMGSSYPAGLGGDHIRYEIYTGLAWGVKRFEYFTWAMPATNWGTAALDWAGNPTPAYYEISEINRQVHNISDIVFPLQPYATYSVNYSNRHGSAVAALPGAFLAQPGSGESMFYSYMWEPDEPFKAPNPNNVENPRYLMVVDDRFNSTSNTSVLQRGARSHTINFANGQPSGLVGLIEYSNLDGQATYIDLAEANYLVTREYLVGEGRLFLLVYERSIGGTVTDAETLMGLEGAKVALLDADGNEVGVTATDSDGNYAFANVRMGDYAVAAEMQGYKPGSVGAKVSGADLAGKDIALAHGYGAEATDPTCTEDGYTTYTCLVCGDVYIVADDGSALGHDGAWVDYDDCKKHICQTCGETMEVAYLNFNGAYTAPKNISSIAENEKNVWTLSFAVEVPYDDGTSRIIEHTVEIGKNSDGEIDLGSYILRYDIKGNGSNIKVFEIVPK